MVLLEKKYTYIHTYIISHNNPSVRIAAYLLTSLILCVFIFYMCGGTYNLKSTFKEVLLTLDGGRPKKYFFHISFCWRCLRWCLNRGFTCSKPARHLHTYIIGHYKPSVRIVDLVSHTTYVVYVNFIHKGGTERQMFLRNFSWQFYLLSKFLLEICCVEIAEENSRLEPRAFHEFYFNDCQALVRLSSKANLILIFLYTW